MPKVKNMPCEVRFYVSEDMHEWLKCSTLERGETLAVFLRSAVSELMEQKGTNLLIYEMSERIKAMSEKMGVEMTENQPDFESKKEMKK